ncbi:MAG: hypothetical protein RLN62_01555 [Rickettsiales bacterium]
MTNKKADTKYLSASIEDVPSREEVITKTQSPRHDTIESIEASTYSEAKQIPKARPSKAKSYGKVIFTESGFTSPLETDTAKEMDSEHEAVYTASEHYIGKQEIKLSSTEPETIIRSSTHATSSVRKIRNPKPISATVYEVATNLTRILCSDASEKSSTPSAPAARSKSTEKSRGL